MPEIHCCIGRWKERIEQAKRTEDVELYRAGLCGFFDMFAPEDLSGREDHTIAVLLILMKRVLLRADAETLDIFAKVLTGDCRPEDNDQFHQLSSMWRDYSARWDDEGSPWLH